jgi:hypothetical protein
MIPPLKLLRQCAVVIALGIFTGCATTTPTEPAKVMAPADAAWINKREVYYRNLGWSTLDARFQAEQDLERGKSSPVEQAHHARRIPN